MLVGCGGSDSPESGDRELTVYVSLPMRGPSGLDGRDAADGARLALEQAAGEAGGVRVKAEFLDDAWLDGWSPVKAGENARAATQDSTAIAYLGDLESGASRISVPITNAAGLLQVSPASAATDLVDELPGSSQISTAQTTGERTFGRVIPGDEAQARAAAEWVDEMKVRTVATASDGSDFAENVLGTFRESLTRATVSRSGELLFFAGQDGQTRSLSQGFEGPQLTTDVALRPDRVRAVTGPLLATSAALDPEQLPPVADEFVGRFIVEYDRPPGRYAAYGYEAMAVILDAIDRASDPTDRDAVVDAFFATRDRDSILGTYSIAENGETTFDQMTGYEIEGGVATPVKALFED
jgi:branched-chain amino acid transport system substrate-binding protein